MKYLMPLIGFVVAILVVGCQGVDTFALSTPSVTPASTYQITPTDTLPLPTASRTPAPTTTSTMVRTKMPSATATVPVEARLKPQCLEVAPALSNEITSNGIIVLQSQVVINGRLKPESYLFDIATGKITTIEHRGAVSISLDRTLMAYGNAILDDQERIVQKDLVIADASGQTLKVIPWEKEWLSILGWVDDQRLVVSASEPDATGQKSFVWLILNPFSSERKSLFPDFPGFLYDSPTEQLPSWAGWFGVIYDPTLTRAIYPQFVENNDQHITYAVWDMSKQQLVTSLENIFSAPAGFNDIYPMPHWSPDGSQFVFRGLVDVSERLVEFELYKVSRDGQVEQLTHLTSIAWVQDSNLSWSPDGRYIAMFLNNWGVDEPQAHVAVLDTTTLEITDYCVPVTYSGAGYGGAEPPAPIWSPDGKQFLVFDWYKRDHQRVILVDIVHGVAAQIAQDAEPVGWMNSIP